MVLLKLSKVGRERQREMEEKVMRLVALTKEEGHGSFTDGGCGSEKGRRASVEGM